MEFGLVEIDTDEWNYMWDFVKTHLINENISEPTLAFNDGEQWMYIGTYMLNDNAIHTFRHRKHPKTNSIYEMTFNASDKFTKDQMKKIVKL